MKDLEENIKNNSFELSTDLGIKPIIIKIFFFLGFLVSAFISQYLTAFNQVVFLWLPAGFALAGVIFFGVRYTPVIFAASFIWNLFFFYTIQDKIEYIFILVSAIIGIGTAVQAYVGSLLLKKYVFAGFVKNQYKSIINYALFAGFVTCFISPLFGVTSLSFVFNNWDLGAFVSNYRIWWLGDSFGAIVVSLPLLYLFSKRTLKGKERRVLHTVLPLLLFGFIGLVLVFGHSSKVNYRDEVLYRMSKDINALHETLGMQNTKNNMALVAIEGYVQPNIDLTQEQFRIFATNILRETPSLHAISWNPIVEQSEAQNFVDKMQTIGGVKDFQIKGSPLDPTDPYVVVAFIEPIEFNKKAQGFNVYSNVERKNAMLEAQQKRGNIPTKLINLVQVNDELGFLVFHPVFKDKNNLKGFSVGVFNSQKLMQAAMSESGISDEIMCVAYSFEDTTPFWQNVTEADNLFVSELKQTFDFEIAGKKWLIEFTPSIAYVESTTGNIRAIFQFFLVFFGAMFALLHSYFANTYILESLRKRREQLMLETTISVIKNSNKIAFERLTKNKENVNSESKIEQAIYTLRSVNSLFHSLIESADSIIIYALDTQFHYLTFNKAHALEIKTLYGTNVSVGDTVFSFIKDSARRKKLVLDYQRGLAGESYTEIEKIEHNNEVFWYQTTYNPIYDSEKVIIGLTCFKIDVTERLELIEKITEAKNSAELTNLMLTQAQAELQKSNDELLSINTTKNKLFSIISHDLRSPFNSMIGFSEYLLNEHKNLDEESRGKYIEYIMQSSKKAFHLLGNLLEWSRSQMGNITYSPDYVHLDKTINEVLSQLEMSAHSKELTLEYSKEGNLIVYADNNLIMTVLRNLIQNAIKFSFRSDKIVITAVRQLEQVVVSIQDFGVGISDENIQNIQQMNDFITESGTEQESGTGLGLHICNEFIQKHNGKLWVERNDEKGSTFYFSIPCKYL